jgi:glycogen(starch) synthase
MRVLHVTPEFPPVIWGGLGTAVGGLANASAREGLEVAVLLVGGVLVLDHVTSQHAYGQPIPAWKGLSAESTVPVNPDGVAFFQVAPDEAIRAAVDLARSWKPDVVHLHTGWLGHVARTIQREAGVPFVFTVHSLDRVEYQHGIFMWGWETQEAAIAAADRVIAISASEKALIAEYCPYALERVRVVGNGIDERPDARDVVRSRKAAGAPLILYSGRFVDRKGIRELLEAIPLVLDQVPGARVVLAGGYGGGAEIERTWLIDVLRPYRDRVHFTGWLTPNDVAAWYAAADILVVPSWYEPFGMVVLEGMLYGLALAASDVGGPAEILEHGRTGILFPPRNAQALADAVIALSADPQLRERIASAGASQVRRRWLWPSLVERMASVYRELLPESAPLAMSRSAEQQQSFVPTQPHRHAA